MSDQRGLRPSVYDPGVSLQSTLYLLENPHRATSAFLMSRHLGRAPEQVAASLAELEACGVAASENVDGGTLYRLAPNAAAHRLSRILIENERAFGGFQPVLAHWLQQATRRSRERRSSRCALP